MKNKNFNESTLEDWVPTEVHNWEGKEENVLVLNYTMTCPLSCNFCCYGCHPKRTEKMPIELAKRLIREAAELASFSSVGFTGGEPLIHYDELLELGVLLNEVNLPFTIATAGHWATTQERADEIIESLSSLGLLRLNVSHDPSHAKFVPSKNIIYAAKAAEKFRVPIYLVGTFFSPEESIEKMLPEIVENSYITFVNKYVAKVGRAERRNISQETYNLDLDLDSLCCYRRVNHDIVVFHDGKTYPCCSTFNRATDGISLGNANIHSLSELWERAEGSISLRIMKRKGFGKFYEIIKKYDFQLYKDLPKSSDSIGPCSLCNKIFSNDNLVPRIRKVYEEYEKVKVDNAIGFMVKKFGIEKTIQIIEK